MMDYAMSKAEVSKFRRLINSDRSKSWTSIDWDSTNGIKGLKKRILAKFRQYAKNYQMINRLKSFG